MNDRVRPTHTVAICTLGGIPLREVCEGLLSVRVVQELVPAMDEGERVAIAKSTLLNQSHSKLLRLLPVHSLSAMAALDAFTQETGAPVILVLVRAERSLAISLTAERVLGSPELNEEAYPWLSKALANRAAIPVGIAESVDHELAIYTEPVPFDGVGVKPSTPVSADPFEKMLSRQAIVVGHEKEGLRASELGGGINTLLIGHRELNKGLARVVAEHVAQVIYQSGLRARHLSA